MHDSRVGEVAVGLDGEHLAPLAVLQIQGHVAAAVVI